MGFLRRRSKRSEFVGPDGETYVAVPEEEVDEWLHPLGEQVFARIESSVPEYVDLAAKTALTQVVLPQLPVASEPSPMDHRMAYTAARVGYFSRVVEFEQRSVNADEHNPHLEDLMVYTASRASFGNDWFANVIGPAAMLMNAAVKDPQGAADVLGPVGLGDEARRRWGAWAMASLLREPDTGEQ